MSIEENKNNNNKLPLISLDKHPSSTKRETFTKSQNNIISYKSNRVNFNSTLKSMVLKKNLMSTTNEISKFKIRSTSTSTNSTNNIKQDKRDYLHNKITLNSLSSSQQINAVRKNYRSFYKKINTNSKSKSKSNSNNNTVDTKKNNDIVDESNELKTYYYRLIKFGNDIRISKSVIQ